MALSKTGLRKRQEKGKACFNVGLNFPEKHAMHLKSYLQCIIFTQLSFFVLIVSTKVKTLKSLLTITDRLTDRKTGCVHIILQPQHIDSSDWSSDKTLQDFFNTLIFVVVPPDKYGSLEENTTLLSFVVIHFINLCETAQQGLKIRC